ncbi:MAG: DNA-directed RNA polymerase subunit omega [Acidobacteria bacterium]|nr:DNA-directed RNA polymerase subunit omega [Acidobacteriota bacterium]
MESNIIQNLYIKVQVITQRAKQLQKGARPRVQLANRKRTIVALKEVELGLISYEFTDGAEPIPATQTAL